MEEHLSDSNFGVEWLASEVGLSSRQLQRRMRFLLNVSAGGHIRLLRLKRASILMESKSATPEEIAAAVGFRDASYFGRMYDQTIRAMSI